MSHRYLKKYLLIPSPRSQSSSFSKTSQMVFWLGNHFFLFLVFYFIFKLKDKVFKDCFNWLAHFKDVAALLRRVYTSCWLWEVKEEHYAVVIVVEDAIWLLSVHVLFLFKALFSFGLLLRLHSDWSVIKFFSVNHLSQGEWLVKLIHVPKQSLSKTEAPRFLDKYLKEFNLLAWLM